MEYDQTYSCYCILQNCMTKRQIRDLPEKRMADVNNDKSINAVDASYILSYYAYASTTKEKPLSLEEFMKKN